MLSLSEIFEPQNDNEKTILAIEALAVSVQLALQKVMVEGGVSQRDLAEKLGVSAARVSQMLSTQGANLTIKTIAKIAHALGEGFELVSRTEVLRARKQMGMKPHLEGVLKFPSALPQMHWEQPVANRNMQVRAKMAAA